jgi:serine/threonine protein kinase/WD40 repeat protein
MTFEPSEDLGARDPAAAPADAATDVSARFRRAAELFEHLRMLPEREREALLADACKDDADLLVEVRSLLAFHDRPSDTLDTAVLRPTVGAVVGRYAILDVLGEGGMGTVYRARQEEPVRREVALKVVKLGMDTRHIVRRFEAERQALAAMEHPNVASVLDAGATTDGRPYFVMELVRGRPITQACDDARLDVRARVRLLLDVCAAVQHAHHKGVIHRDLKPSNILVARVDGRLVPKVIDFGVAKALSRGPNDRVTSTNLGEVFGTPDSMSPEQATGADVDVRSDVYALGVLLYELLVGTTPLRAALKARALPRQADGGDARAGAGPLRPVPPLDELRRIVRDLEPVRPSAAAEREGMAAVAALRGVDERTLRRSLRSDIEWILRKALETQPGRRYPTVAALADDLERWLAHEPVQARAPSTAYLVATFARRHTALLAAATAIAIAVVGGLILALYALEIIGAERDAAISAQNRQTQLAEDLRAQLFQSDVDRGRRRIVEGHLNEARDLLWGSSFAQPTAPQAAWALREMMWSVGPLTTFAFDERVRSVRLVPGGRRAFVAFEHGSPALVDPADGRIERFAGPPHDACDAAVAPDGTTAVVADFDGTTTLWSLGERKFLRVLAQGPSGRTFARFVDERSIVVLGRDGALVLVDRDDPATRSLLAHHDALPRRVIVAPTGMIAAGYEDGTVVVVDPPDRAGRRASRALRVDTRPITSLAFDAHGRRLASASTSRAVRVHRLPDLAVEAVFTVGPTSIVDLAFADAPLDVPLSDPLRDSEELLVFEWWEVIGIDLATGAERSVLPLSGTSVDRASDGGNIVFGQLGGPVVAIVETGRDAKAMQVPLPPQAIPFGFGLAGTFVASRRGTDLVGSAPDGTVLWTIELGTRPRHAVPSPDGRRFALLFPDRTLRVFELSGPDASGRIAPPSELLRRSGVHPGEYGSVRFSRDGSLLAYATRSNGVELIDVDAARHTDAEACAVLAPRDSEILAVEHRPDGRSLVVCERDGDVSIVDFIDGTQRTQRIGGAFSACVNADGSTAALAMWGGDLVLLDLLAERGDGGTRLARGHSAFASRLVPHPTDPNLLLSSSDDGTVRVWHVGLGRELASLAPFGRRVAILTVAWTDGGRSITIVGPTGETLVFSLDAADRAIEASRAAETLRQAQRQP